MDLKANPVQLRLKAAYKITIDYTKCEFCSQQEKKNFFYTGHSKEFQLEACYGNYVSKIYNPQRSHSLPLIFFFKIFDPRILPPPPPFSSPPPPHFYILHKYFRD